MELIRTLAVLAEPPTDRCHELAALLEFDGPPDASDHTELFTFQLYPYASVYTGVEGALGGDARDRVAGFWRALGLQPPAEPDHLTALLGLYAHLRDREVETESGQHQDAWGRARRALLWEHLLSWLGPYLEKMVRIAPPFYEQWARLLRRTLWDEAARAPRPPELPLHLRAADERPGNRDDDEDPLGGVLAPVRSGLILTRADLARASRELGLGLRAGERRYALDALLGQDRVSVSQWLASAAADAAQAYEADAETLGPIAVWWQSRARATAAELDAVARARNEERRTKNEERNGGR